MVFGLIGYDLDLVALAAPYPPDYGGAMDMYYKIRALDALGLRVRLHAFTYQGRHLNWPELRSYCRGGLWAYRRNYGLTRPHWPHVVASRRVPALLEALAQGQGPILFEGVHCSAFLGHADLRHRPQALRLHNHEAAYYRALAGLGGSSSLRRAYWYWEANRLGRWEPQQLKAANKLWTLSQTEQLVFEQWYPNKTEWLPPFHGNMGVESPLGWGQYLLYQGNLAIAENRSAVLWLAEKVLPHVHFPVLIAGRNPDAALLEVLKALPLVQVEANPSPQRMKQIMQGAHIQLLPTFQATGVKLKLLQALHQSRFCLCNALMLAGTGLEDLCFRAGEPEAWIALIQQLIKRPFLPEDLAKRRDLLGSAYSDVENAKKILTWIEGREGGARA